MGCGTWTSGLAPWCEAAGLATRWRPVARSRSPSPPRPPLPGHISTPNSGREGLWRGGGAETDFHILQSVGEVGKEKCS